MICVVAIGAWTHRVWRALLDRMGRKLRIRVAFEPTRLSPEHLRVAYTMIVAVSRRRIGKGVAGAGARSSAPESEPRKREKMG